MPGSSYDAAKRALDLVVSIAVLVVLSPLYLLIGLLVLIFMGYPVLYISPRLDSRARLFRMLKFRTMTNDTDENGNLLPDEVRLRPFGRFLRRTSLDELPQIVNVLSGEMSIVGPRAIPPGFLKDMAPRFRPRLSVKPGLTGWTQVNYRGEHRTQEEKYTYDVEYVDSRSILFDLKILVLTLRTLLLRFKGNKSGVSFGDEA